MIQVIETSTPYKMSYRRHISVQEKGEDLDGGDGRGGEGRRGAEHSHGAVDCVNIP